MTAVSLTSTHVPLQDLLKEGDSIYKLVLLAARRALELSEGAPPLTAVTTKQPSTMALEEIRAGTVSYRSSLDATGSPTKKKRDKGA